MSMTVMEGILIAKTAKELLFPDKPELPEVQITDKRNAIGATAEVLRRDPALEIAERPLADRDTYRWFHPSDTHYFDFPEGLEAETGELLYALTMIIRAKRVLETGTRTGISTRYIALGLEQYGGLITTIERDNLCRDYALEKFKAYNCIESIYGSSLEYNPEAGTVYDMLFLDSEPCYRYEEMEKFYPYVREGGMIIIHDLARIPDKGFGIFPNGLKEKLLLGELHCMSFRTSSGLTIFQKRTATERN
jgi:predicted O-methyltransferase YrrM